MGRSPNRQTIWCILEPKREALVAAVFVDFPNSKCKRLKGNNEKHCSWVQFLTGRRPVSSFFSGAVATIAPWKSVPMCVCVGEGGKCTVARASSINFGRSCRCATVNSTNNIDPESRRRRREYIRPTTVTHTHISQYRRMAQ